MNWFDFWISCALGTSSVKFVSFWPTYLLSVTQYAIILGFYTKIQTKTTSVLYETNSFWAWAYRFRPTLTYVYLHFLICGRVNRIFALANDKLLDTQFYLDTFFFVKPTRYLPFLQRLLIPLVISVVKMS